MRTISWSELVTLMVHGPDLPTRGRLRHTEGASSTGGIGWVRTYRAPVPPPFATGVEVVMSGRRLRLADATGRLTMITDGTTAWSFDPETPDAPPRESPLDHVEFGLAGSDVLVRTTARSWLDHDAQDGPVPTAATHAGRAAWALELTPPYRTHRAVQIVVDAETGMLLQQRDDERGHVIEWSDIVVGADLDPSVFTWDGPVVTWAQQLAEAQRDGERQQAQWEQTRERWTLEQLGTKHVSITVVADLLVRDLDDDGTLHASLGELGSVDRRPRSDSSWPEVDRDNDDDGLVQRWSDERWDWAVRTYDTPLTDASIEALRDQLNQAATSD